MAVQYFATSFGSGSQVLAGFESGHLVQWDTRNPSVVMSSIKLYEEPGVWIFVCIVFVCVLCVCERARESLCT